MRLTGASNIDDDTTRSAGSLSRPDAETEAPLRVLLVEEGRELRLH